MESTLHFDQHQSFRHPNTLKCTHLPKIYSNRADVVEQFVGVQRSSFEMGGFWYDIRPVAGWLAGFLCKASDYANRVKQSPQALETNIKLAYHPCSSMDTRRSYKLRKVYNLDPQDSWRSVGKATRTHRGRLTSRCGYRQFPKRGKPASLCRLFLNPTYSNTVNVQLSYHLHIQPAYGCCGKSVWPNEICVSCVCVISWFYSIQVTGLMPRSEGLAKT